MLVLKRTRVTPPKSTQISSASSRMIPALLHAERVDACSGSHAEVEAQSRRELCAFAETDPIGRTLRRRIHVVIGYRSRLDCRRVLRKKAVAFSWDRLRSYSIATCLIRPRKPRRPASARNAKQAPATNVAFGPVASQRAPAMTLAASMATPVSRLKNP